jgi:hypothetical protein
MWQMGRHSPELSCGNYFLKQTNLSLYTKSISDTAWKVWNYAVLGYHSNRLSSVNILDGSKLCSWTWVKSFYLIRNVLSFSRLITFSFLVAEETLKEHSFIRSREVTWHKRNLHYSPAVSATPPLWKCPFDSLNLLTYRFIYNNARSFMIYQKMLSWRTVMSTTHAWFHLV